MLGKVYANIRKRLVSSKRGVVVLLLVAPLFLLPDDLKDRNGIYGCIARSYIHVVWVGLFFAFAYLKFSNELVSTLSPDLIEEKLFGFVPASLVLTGSSGIVGFLIACAAILIGSTIAWGFHSICGTIARRYNQIAVTPKFIYFTMQWGVLFCWLGVIAWGAKIAFPYVIESNAPLQLIQYSSSTWFALVPIMIISLLGMRRNYIRQKEGEQIYPNPGVRLLVHLASIMLWAASMTVIILAAAMV